MSTHLKLNDTQSYLVKVQRCVTVRLMILKCNQSWKDSFAQLFKECVLLFFFFFCNIHAGIKIHLTKFWGALIWINNARSSPNLLELLESGRRRSEQEIEAGRGSIKKQGERVGGSALIFNFRPSVHLSQNLSAQKTLSVRSTLQEWTPLCHPHSVQHTQSKPCCLLGYTAIFSTVYTKRL